jgi:hypothetical protein
MASIKVTGPVKKLFRATNSSAREAIVKARRVITLTIAERIDQHRQALKFRVIKDKGSLPTYKLIRKELTCKELQDLFYSSAKIPLVQKAILQDLLAHPDTPVELIAVIIENEVPPSGFTGVAPFETVFDPHCYRPNDLEQISALLKNVPEDKRPAVLAALSDGSDKKSPSRL